MGAVRDCVIIVHNNADTAECSRDGDVDLLILALATVRMRGGYANEKWEMRNGSDIHTS